MPVVRTASIRDLPVHIKVDHLLQADSASARVLQPGERVHDSQPHHEKVVFNVEVDWIGTDVIGFEDRIESVFNYSPIYHLLADEFHERTPLKSPLESILDLIVSKARIDHRVIAVRASAERPNILLNGAVCVAVHWTAEPQQDSPLPQLETLSGTDLG